MSLTLSRRTFVTGALAGGVGGIAATTAAHAIIQRSDANGPSENAQHDDHDTLQVDIGFCTDMSAHHIQAVAMCERVLGQDTLDAVQAAATEVLRNQSIEIGMMRAWLADWGASTAPPERVMGWMTMSMESDMKTDMAGGDGIPLADMPGYATDAQLQELTGAEPGVAKGRIWLQLMRAHHVGGVSMALAAAELASTEKVLRLARAQAEVQTFEISQYDQLLNTIYA